MLVHVLKPGKNSVWSEVINEELQQVHVFPLQEVKRDGIVADCVLVL